MAKYDPPPYMAASAGCFLFVNIGNQYLVAGARLTPSDPAKLT
jgi:hypothetical protein